MKLEKDQKDYIVKAFHSMQNREDFVKLLNYAKKIIYGEKTVFFDLRQLTYYSNPNVNTRRYVSFEVPKKNKEPRRIHAPVKGLLVIQKCLNLILGSVFTPAKFATGFVQGLSIVDNAAFHAGNYYVYNIDLKDFFHSFDQARVWKCLQLKPLSLSIVQDRESKDYNPFIEVVNIISALVCTKLTVKRFDEKGVEKEVVKNVLPQGAPTSPILTNIVCQKLDYLLSATAKKFGLKYSRYADDITFSSLHNVYQKESPFLLEIQRIINDQGFVINENKVRLQKDGFKQVVTGLIVNKHPNVSKKFIDSIKIDLYYWERYGYERASKFFKRNYIKLKKHNKNHKAEMSNVLTGRIQYLKMVRGADNPVYKKLNDRLQVLITEKKNVAIRPEDIHFKSMSEFDKTLGSDESTKSGLKKLISNLIESSYISEIDKREILDAASKELEKLTMPTLISKTINDPSNINLESRKKEHSPKDVAQFMSLFNQRDGLKYLTHDFDEEGEFKISYFLEKWKNTFEIASKGKNGYEIPSSLYRIIEEFAFSNRPSWTSVNGRSIYDGWSTDKWINWSSNNKLHPLRNPVLKIVIDDFRRLTRIESPNLDFFVKEAISEAFSLAVEKPNIKLQEIYRADFYTHVPSLKRALLAIFSMMAKYGGNKDISVAYQRSTQDSFFVRKLIVSQNDSYPTKDLGQILSEWNGEKGAMGGIKNNLFGYCNWSIETMIDGTPYRVNILKDKNSPSYEKLNQENVLGFTHILTYYYL